MPGRPSARRHRSTHPIRSAAPRHARTASLGDSLHPDRNPRARAAALQAIFITGAGGLALLAGLIIVGQSAGTYRISEMIDSPPSGAALSAGIVCVLLGAFTKSAQAPFGSWLPGAMVAPTPISAYLHSATMVKAGVYLVARLSHGSKARLPIGWNKEFCRELRPSMDKLLYLYPYKCIEILLSY